MIPPQVIAAIVGAAVGAGKTALDKEHRKDWKSYLMNGLSGAAAGAAGGMGAESAGAAAMGGLKGSFGGGGGGLAGFGDFGDDGGMGIIAPQRKGRSPYDTPPIVPEMGDDDGWILHAAAQKGGLPPLQDGEFDYNDPSIPGGLPRPGDQGPLQGRVEKGGLSPKAQAAVDLLKTYINRPRTPYIPSPLPQINAPNPLMTQFGGGRALPQMQVAPMEPIMLRRRNY